MRKYINFGHDWQHAASQIGEMIKTKNVRGTLVSIWNCRICINYLMHLHLRSKSFLALYSIYVVTMQCRYADVCRVCKHVATPTHPQNGLGYQVEVGTLSMLELTQYVPVVSWVVHGCHNNQQQIVSSPIFHYGKFSYSRSW